MILTGTGCLNQHKDPNSVRSFRCDQLKSREKKNILETKQKSSLRIFWQKWFEMVLLKVFDFVHTGVEIWTVIIELNDKKLDINRKVPFCELISLKKLNYNRNIMITHYWMHSYVKNYDLSVSDIYFWK